MVFGDIGTSPLYTVRELFFGTNAPAHTEANVLGALSLIFLTLTLVVTVKYVVFVIRIDHHGEGGMLALLGLLLTQRRPGAKAGRPFRALIALISIGAALLYGDGVITPAISVLSAWEGLRSTAPVLEPLIVPITLLTLFLLFLVQRGGTSRVGRWFGPVMIVWFAAIGAAGLVWIVRHPEVLKALNPLHAFRFLADCSWRSIYVLGAAVLCITGGEALYADLGHFGRRAIRVSWYALVYPALLLNYFGQGARLLDRAPIPDNHVFYALFPADWWWHLPVVVLATLATVIASQALISGAFSLTRQAIGLGLFPRLRIINTSAEIEGQIYMPAVNWMLFLGCALLVLTFRNSGSLAAAYGIAVTGTMAITTIAYLAVSLGQGARFYLIGPICIVFIGVDLLYFAANSWKILDGGLVPIGIAAVLFSLMRTWQWGRHTLATAYARISPIPMRRLVELKQRLLDSPALRIEYSHRTLTQLDRAIVFLASRPVVSLDDPCPMGLRIYLKRNGALPKHVTLVSVEQVQCPTVPDEERVLVYALGANVVSVIARYGYMQAPDITGILRQLKQSRQIKINENRWTVQIGEDELILDPSLTRLRRLRIQLFRLLLRITTSADRYFGLVEYAGRAKTVIPVRVTNAGARIVVIDDESV